MPAPAARLRFTRRLLAVFVALGVLTAASDAFAAFVDSTPASHTLSTAALEPPTNPAASTDVCDALDLVVTVNVTWTATPSTWADGYEVLTSSAAGGPYTVAATVAGRSTTTASITGVGLGTTVYIVVRASKASWRSSLTSEVAYTAPLVCV